MQHLQGERDICRLGLEGLEDLEDLRDLQDLEEE
jgi:hypothetical protein